MINRFLMGELDYGVSGFNGRLQKMREKAMNRSPKAPAIDADMYNPTFTILEAANQQALILGRLISQANTCALNTHTPIKVRHLTKDLIAELQSTLSNAQNYLRSLQLTANSWDTTASTSLVGSKEPPSSTAFPETKRKKKNYDENIPMEEFNTRLRVIDNLLGELKNETPMLPPRPLEVGEYPDHNYQEGDFFKLKAYPEMLCEVKTITSEGDLWSYIHKGLDQDLFWISGSYGHFPEAWTVPVEKNTSYEEFALGDLFCPIELPHLTFKITGRTVPTAEVWAALISGKDGRYPRTHKSYVFPTSKIRKVKEPSSDFAVGDYATVNSEPGTVCQLLSDGKNDLRIEAFIVTVPSDSEDGYKVGQKIFIDKSYLTSFPSSVVYEDNMPKSYKAGDHFTLHVDTSVEFEVTGKLTSNTVQAKCCVGNAHLQKDRVYTIVTNYTIPTKTEHTYKAGDLFRIQNVKAEVFEVIKVEGDLLRAKFIKGFLSKFHIGHVYLVSAAIAVPVQKEELDKKFTQQFNTDAIVCLNKNIVGLVMGTDECGFSEIQIVQTDDEATYKVGKTYSIDPDLLSVRQVEKYKVGEYFRFASDKHMIAQVIQANPLSLLGLVVRNDSDNFYQAGTVYEFAINDKIKKSTRPLQNGDVVKISTYPNFEFKVVKTDLADIGRVRLKCSKTSNANPNIHALYVEQSTYDLERRIVSYAEQPETRNFYVGQTVSLVDSDLILFYVKHAMPNASKITVICFYSKSKEYVAGSEYKIDSCLLEQQPNLPESTIVSLCHEPPQTIFMIIDKANDRASTFNVKCLHSNSSIYKRGRKYVLPSEKMVYPVIVGRVKATKVIAFENEEPLVQFTQMDEGKDFTGKLAPHALARALNSYHYSVNDKFLLGETSVFRVCHYINRFKVLAECLRSNEKYLPGVVYEINTKEAKPFLEKNELEYMFDSGDIVSDSVNQFVFRFYFAYNYASCVCIKSSTKSYVPGCEYLVSVNKLQFAESMPKDLELTYHRLWQPARFQVLFEKGELAYARCREKGGVGSPFLEGDDYYIDKQHLSCFPPALFHQGQEVTLKDCSSPALYFAVESASALSVKVRCKHYCKDPFHEFDKIYTYKPEELVLKKSQQEIGLDSIVRLKNKPGVEFTVCRFLDMGATIGIRPIKATADFLESKIYDYPKEDLEVVNEKQFIPGQHVTLKKNSKAQFYIHQLDGKSADVHATIDCPPYQRYTNYKFPLSELVPVYEKA
jgi:hypothetical protein